MPISRLSFLAAMAACLLPAMAQEPVIAGDGTARQEMQQIVDVQSARDPDLRPYRTMLRGLDAYADHLQLAPAAPLRFMLLPSTPEDTLDDVTLHLSADNLSIPIPLSAEGTFVLSRDKTAYDANADLVSNKKRASLRWQPDIHTPGLPPNVRRLGDLRLECEVRWAVEQEQLSFIMRNFFRMAGGPCHSALIHVPFPSRHTLASVEARSSTRSMSVRLKEDLRRYVPPLHDRSWDDNTLLILTYASETMASGKHPAINIH
ncbi:MULTISPECIES: hypothetical protein [unclassified Janthinobacterium]|uniref:hypothetical protein n=1 Tax=unclassified Janthinobacterium TaxID=2610881 RepID=UPI001616105D|nr:MULTISPECIES: hypothetical protein [unclassified Janthinobacterium]MBB5610799.1 hypothetical protein [Janthinobacterium sp. S3T4]MBB5616285.1 hypothetical protein [Janthinobacterium sp. S3M3]